MMIRDYLEWKKGLSAKANAKRIISGTATKLVPNWFRCFKEDVTCLKTRPSFVEDEALPEMFEYPKRRTRTMSANLDLS